MIPDNTPSPDFKAIAERLAEATVLVSNYRDMLPHGMAARRAYASCMEAKLKGDWETISELKDARAIMHRANHVDGCPMTSLWDPSPCNCGYDATFASIDARLSTLEKQFTP